MPVKKKATPAAGKAAAAIIDFSNVKERGNFNPKNIESGDYVAEITKVEQTEAKDGESMWVFSVVLEDVPRATYPYYCKLVDNQFWKVKALFGAAGVNVGQRKVKVDPNKLVGKTIGVAMEDDEYEGRLKSVIAEVFPPDEVTGEADTAPEDDDLEEDEIEEETPKRTKKKPAPEPEEEDEEDEEDEEEKPAPKKRTARKKKPVVEEDDEEDDDELEIDEL